MESLFDPSLAAEQSVAENAAIAGASVRRERFRMRPYQREAIDASKQQLEESNSTLNVMATGTGKTPVAATLLKEMGGRAMVFAHRDTLIRQLARTIEAVTGIRPSIEMGDEWADPGAQIVVGSIQTQNAGMDGEGRMTRFDPADFDLVIADEAHHFVAESFERVLNYYRQNPSLKVAGFTATPDRADERALGRVFETVAYEYDIADAVRDGWLVKPVARQIYIADLDFSDVKTTAGDLNQSQLSKILEEEGPLHEMARPIVELAGDRRTLVFCVTKEHARAMSRLLNRYKPDSSRWIADHVKGREREKLFEDYSAGRFQFLCNVGIVGEGVDVPGIEVVAMCRPTKSRAVYAQAVGRGTRPLPDAAIDGCDTADERKEAIAASDKPHCEIIDFVGNSGKHKLITPDDILGGNYEDDVIERAKEMAADERDSAKPSDVADRIERAKQALLKELEEQRQEEKRKNIKARVDYSSRITDPFNVFDMEPRKLKGWDEGKAASQKQVDAIKKMTKGEVDASQWSRKHASQFLDKLIGRSKHGYPSYKMTKFLKARGYPENIRFEAAKAIIDATKQNRWKTLPKERVDQIVSAHKNNGNGKA